MRIIIETTEETQNGESGVRISTRAEEVKTQQEAQLAAVIVNALENLFAEMRDAATPRIVEGR